MHSDVQPVDPDVRVVLLIRELGMFGDAEAEVPRLIELRARDRREGKRGVEELLGALASEGDLRTDRVALPDAELGFGGVRTRPDALLARDRFEDLFGVCEFLSALADTHVGDDLLDDGFSHLVELGGLAHSLSPPTLSSADSTSGSSSPAVVTVSSSSSSTKFSSITTT